MGMILPNNTLWGFGIQQDGAGTEYAKMAAGYEHPVSNANYFYYYPQTDVGFGPTKNQDTLPPENGGRALPSGAYVTGVWNEGATTIIPRLDNRFGWLLLAAMGDVSTVSDVTIAQHLAGSGTTAGVNTHIFNFYASDQYFVPWLTFRRELPHPTAANQLGEESQDGKIRTLTLNIAAAAPVTCDIDAIARSKQSNYDFEFDPGWTATYDDLDDFAVANCDGHFKVEGTAFKVTNVAVTLTNQLLPANQSIHVGSIDPLDFPTLGRMMTITATILVEDYGLYVSTFSGVTNDGATDANASCIVYKADVDVMVASQTYITGSEPFRLRVVSNTAENNVAWQVRPIRVQANRPIVLQVTANVLATATGYPVSIYLQNDKANYNLP